MPKYVTPRYGIVVKYIPKVLYFPPHSYDHVVPDYLADIDALFEHTRDTAEANGVPYENVVNACFKYLFRNGVRPATPCKLVLNKLKETSP